MSYENVYKKALKKLLNDDNICKENKELFKKFFEFQEYKLKRINGLPKLDEGAYHTLDGYVTRCRNVNMWFGNKPLHGISREDFKKVYDDLEDGKIKNKQGKPFKDRASYYNKMFRSKLFDMIDKADLAKDILDMGTAKKDSSVRFIEEATFRKMVDVTVSVKYKALLWLAFDVGENIRALLQLQKKDIVKQTDEHTKLPEYRINLHKDILKRSRLERSELTNYQDTVNFLDLVLEEKKDNDYVFDFEYSASVKFLKRAVRITKARCIPKGEPVTWKDLRSSMSCDLLKKGWTRDEINRRLGHRPSSSEMDKYINFLAIDGKKPQRKVFEHNLSKIQYELEDARQREKLQQLRFEELRKEHEQLMATVLHLQSQSIAKVK